MTGHSRVLTEHRGSAVVTVRTLEYVDSHGRDTEATREIATVATFERDYLNR